MCCSARRALGANLGVRPLGGAFQGLRLSQPVEFVDPQRPEYPAGLDFASRKSAASNPHRALCCCLVLPHSPPRDRVNAPFPSPQIFLSAASLLAYSRLPYDFLPPSPLALPSPLPLSVLIGVDCCVPSSDAPSAVRLRANVPHCTLSALLPLWPLTFSSHLSRMARLKAVAFILKVASLLRALD